MIPICSGVVMQKAMSFDFLGRTAARHEQLPTSVNAAGEGVEAVRPLLHVPADHVAAARLVVLVMP